MHPHRDSKQGRCRMNIEMKDIYKWRTLFASMKLSIKIERWCQMLGTTKKTKSIFLIQENALVS